MSTAITPAGINQVALATKQGPAEVVVKGKVLGGKDQEMASTFDPVAFYQSLPDLEHAVLTLSTVDFDKLLEKVTDLLRPYGDKYGLCLLHRHFPLFKDEIMVESGNVMQPTLKTGDGQFYEKRWDRFGRAYEYSVGEQEIIPVQLLQDFREIVPKSTSLGIYSRKGDDETVQWMEYTDPEFRTHTNRPRTEESDDAPQTACYSKDGQPSPGAAVVLAERTMSEVERWLLIQ